MWNQVLRLSHLQASVQHFHDYFELQYELVVAQSVVGKYRQSEGYSKEQNAQCLYSLKDSPDCTLIIIYVNIKKCFGLRLSRNEFHKLDKCYQDASS